MKKIASGVAKKITQLSFHLLWRYNNFDIKQSEKSSTSYEIFKIFVSIIQNKVFLIFQIFY